ncbi:PQQ-binding-like beta-propeller repeat protein [Streptomyces sp. PmtG]
MSYGPPHSEFTESARAADRAQRQRRTRAVAGLAALLALVLCTGGWMIWAAADDEDTRRNPAAAPQAPDDIRDTAETTPRSLAGRKAVEYVEDDLKAAYGRDTVHAPGAWATDKTFVRGVGAGLKGFAFGTLEEKWSTRLDGPICDTTRHVTVDGRTAVLFQARAESADRDKRDDKKSDNKKDSGKGKKPKDKKPKSKSKNKKDDKKSDGKKKNDGKKKRDKGKPSRADSGAGTVDPYVCDRLAMVDLNTGKKLWQVRLPEATHAFAPNTNVTMTRGTVAVAWGRGSAAYAMDGGERLWKNTGVKSCRDSGFAGGRALLALVACGDPAAPAYRVQAVDPRTGKPTWTYKVARGVKGVYLVSSSPAVLAVAAGDIVPTDLITLDDRGAYQATIDLPEKRYVDTCHRQLFGGVETCDSIVVGRDQLFLATEGDIGDGNWIVSFDLATGKTVRKFGPKGLARVYPLRMSGDKLLALRPGDQTTPSAVISLDPGTGKEAPFLLFGTPRVSNLTEPGESDVIVEDGRVFFAPRELETENTGEWKGTAYGALGVEPS